MGYLEDRANLSGKVAAVVGGASGVGAAVTMALAHAGVDIAFCDIKRDAVESTRAEVEQLGRRVTGRVTDALEPEQLAAFYEAFDHDFDRLDIVVNVVGGVLQRHFADTSVEQWTADIHRNLGWAMQSMSLAIPRIRAGGRGGSIVSFTTIEAHRGAAGCRAESPTAPWSVSAAWKAACSRSPSRGRREPAPRDRSGAGFSPHPAAR